eukprot:gene26287-31754_t
MLFLCFLIAFYAVFTAAAPADWVGTYTEPIYGGNLAVCVSTITDSTSGTTTYYGQAVMSSVGYLRGTIAGNVWTGQYVLAGAEAINGDFVLVLDPTTSTYSGNYTQAGSSIVATATGTQTSASTPSDLECFKVDDDLLTQTTFFDMTGVYGVASTPNYMYSSDGYCQVSYTYYYSDGTPSPGTGYGPTFWNGQVYVFNWYETGSDEGIEIEVAKNSTTNYYVWWFIPSMSSFDYSSGSTPGNTATNYRNKLSGYSYADAVTGSSEYMCYALWTTSAESSCIGATSDDDDDDDDGDGINSHLVGTAAAFSVLTFVAVVAFGALPYVMKPAVPLAAQAAASSSSATANSQL